MLSLLYRLALGRIGISEQGVNYLGRQFDVGMTTGFVSRLTADGNVGVFDELKRLVGLFRLESGDFTTDHESTIQKNLQDITLEMLFTPSPDETPEERKRKEQLLEEFKSKYWQTYKELFAGMEEKSGFRFNNLSLPEQGFVLLYLDKYEKNSPEHQRFFSFLEKYGEDGFRVFRVLEDSDEMADAIFKVAENLPAEVAQKVFAKYTEIIQEIDRVEAYLLEISEDDQEKRPELEIQIRRNLLSAGRRLLRDIAKGEMSVEDIMSKLERCRSDVLLYAATLSELKRQNVDMSSFDMPNVGVETLSGDQLSDDDKRQMLLISHANWAERGAKGEQVTGDFENLLSRDPAKLAASTFYILRHGESVLSFFLLRTENDGRYYCGSFNVSPDVKGTDNLKLAVQMLRSAIGGKRVWAKCDPKSAVSPLWINEVGFRATGLENNSLIIEHDSSDEPSRLAGRSIKELVTFSSSRSSEAEVRLYTFPAEFEIFAVEAADLFGQKMAITNFQRGYTKAGSYQVAIAFERLVRAPELVAR